ncbi:hypothetical protein F1728_09130 [Gimesia benthica]|uniref:Uncharacterized protein n=1 Tax=Gimesia benthica TaxID=2608982 RepID=A0A6I6ACW3_9PLAN|nr:hypothetical protein [Gimesia benthica]QGQ22829.1 hypothetical protein F1728_09130 [Gimesia benthica]
MSQLKRFILVAAGLYGLCMLLPLEYVHAQSSGSGSSAPMERPGSPAFDRTLPNSSQPASSDKQNGTPPSAAESTGKPATEEATQQGLYIRGADGQFLPLPNLNLDQVLEYLKQKQAPQTTPSPEYAVSSVSLQGNIKEDRAILDARLVILINEADQWVRVPLKLNESIFLKTNYNGAGESSPGGFNRTDGYLWWFKGKGTHELNLTLSVSLKQQLPSRRLQLVLPQTAVSNLKLTVPLPQISLEVPTGVAVSKKSLDDDQSQIELFGLGNSWICPGSRSPMRKKSIPFFKPRPC